jgi:hypothetical protein
MTQCQRRGTPERDDTKPSRENIVSHLHGVVGNDFLELSLGNPNIEKMKMKGFVSL